MDLHAKWLTTNNTYRAASPLTKGSVGMEYTEKNKTKGKQETKTFRSSAKTAFNIHEFPQT
jgi:hypothetical protein